MRDGFPCNPISKAYYYRTLGRFASCQAKRGWASCEGELRGQICGHLLGAGRMLKGMRSAPSPLSDTKGLSPTHFLSPNHKMRVGLVEEGCCGLAVQQPWGPGPDPVSPSGKGTIPVSKAEVRQYVQSACTLRTSADRVLFPSCPSQILRTLFSPSSTSVTCSPF